MRGVVLGRFKQTFRRVFVDEHAGAQKQQNRDAGKSVAKKLFAALIILIIAALVILLVHGNYVTLYFNVAENITADNISVSFEREGIANVRDISVKNRVASVAIEKVSDGNMPFKVKIGDTIHEFDIDTSKPLIFIPQLTAFPCWQLIIYFSFIFCLTAAIVFALQYRKESSGTFFSTSAIYFVGFAVFFALSTAFQ